MARKSWKSYEPEMVKEYVQAHLEYAAKVIAPFLPDMSVQDIINTVEKDGAIPKTSSLPSLSEEKRNCCGRLSRTPASRGSRF